MATREEVEAARGRVDSLRDQILDAKAATRSRNLEAENDVTLDVLASEETKLAAELAALRGETVEQPTVDGYIVPMGTQSVDTDVMELKPEDAPVDVVVVPGETPEPVVVKVTEPDTKTETKTETKTKGA